MVTSFDLNEDSFAIYTEYNDGASDYDAWALSVREIADVDLDLNGTALLPVPSGVNYFYVYIDANYERGSATTAVYSVSDEDPKNSSSSNYNPDAVVIGRVPVTPLSSTLTSWDMNTDSVWDDVMAVRTTPQPDKVTDRSNYTVGDLEFGYVDGIERYGIPTVDQKDAMTNASSPDASNPFAVENETTKKWFAEPKEVRYEGLSNITYIEIPATTKVYIGKNSWDLGNGTNKYFDVRSATASPYSGVPLHGSDGGRIGVYYISAIGGGGPINPSTAADANGFVDGCRVNFDFTNTVDTDYSGNLLLYYGEGKQLKDLSETPAFAMAIAGRTSYPHATEIITDQTEVPAYAGDDNVSSAFQYRLLKDQLEKIYLQTCGTLPRGYDFIDLVKEARYAGKEDVQIYNSNNEFTLAASSTTSYRMIGMYRKGISSPQGIWRYLIVISGKTTIRQLNLDDDMAVIGTKSAAADLKTAVIAGEGSSGDWELYDGCVDGDSVYLRAYETTGSNRHCVYCVNVENMGASTKWGSKPYVFLSGTGAPITEINDYGDRAYSIINADDTYIATNNPHLQLTTTAIAGVQLINRSTGVISDSGCGNGNGTNHYAYGFLISDGTNIVASGRDTTADEELVFNCSMADLTTNNLSLSYTDSLSEPRAMWGFFDGENFWFNVGRAKIHIYNVADDTQLTRLFADNVTFTLEWMGHGAFDGKNVWFVHYVEDSDARRRLELACIPAARTFNYNNEGPSTLTFEYIERLIVKSFSIISGGNASSYSDPPEWDEMKEVFFDGRDVLINMGGSLTSTLDGKARRLTNIKDR
jgi:hypothetical protein